MLLYLAIEKCSFDDQQFITDIYFRFKPAMIAIAQNYVSSQHDIEDMKADGVYDQEYVDEELKKANHWATIGIGKENYYKNIISRF